MVISFHGAARTVTGSKHLIKMKNGKQILLDCGMFQGMGTNTLKLNDEFGFEPSEVDYVIISHAHIDHVGLLPKLVKEGYHGYIYCTSATESLAKILLRDSAHIQEADTTYANKIKEAEGRPKVQPLYNLDDVLEVFELFKIVQYDEWTAIDEDIKVMFTDAGHILGSASVHLQIVENEKTNRVTFSGDIGRYGDLFLRSPAPFDQADYIIMESTYGDKYHPYESATADILYKNITETCLNKKGKLIIPAFSVGRTQELLYALNQLELERRLPALKYYVDSPLSVETTNITKQYADLFNSKVHQVLKVDGDPFNFKGLNMIKDVEASKALNFTNDPCVIISASGMAEAGRVKHHIANNIENPSATILIVGYAEPLSLAGRLRNGTKEVGIFGRTYKVKADVVVVGSLSAHGDYNDLSQWLSCQDPQKVKKLFLVHGEYEVQIGMKQKLIRKGFEDVLIPKLHEEIGLGN